MRINKVVLLVALFFIGLNVVKAQVQDRPFPVHKKLSVIFDTDMGNDIDDGLALDMMFKYMDSDRVKLLAIMNNKDSEYSTRFLDLFSTWYGYPDIPIGKIEQGAILDDYIDYSKNVVLENEKSINPFKYSRKDHDNLLPSYALYRKLLAKQPDHSVVIVSVGFSTNLFRLLNSVPDQYSKLNGHDLIAKKVVYLSAMAGSFGKDKRAEFNIIHDLSAARYVFNHWPTGIVLSPFEVGTKVIYPGKSIETDFTWTSQHPLVEAYTNYRPMPYDRPTWDLTSVYYTVEDKDNLLEISKPGILWIDERGFTYFKEEQGGKHYVLSISDQNAPKLKQYFIDLIKQKPEKQRGE